MALKVYTCVLTGKSGNKRGTLEADIDGEENSDKDISECSVSQLQKESKNTSMASGSSKGMWITMIIRILETLRGNFGFFYNIPYNHLSY